MDLNDTVDVETLEPPAKQHIKFIEIRSGFYIDAIGIVTNQGKKISSIGGTGGSQRKLPYEILHSKHHPYVGGIQGKTVVTQGLPTICEVMIKYIIPDRYDTDPPTDSSSEISSTDESDTDSNW